MSEDLSNNNKEKDTKTKPIYIKTGQERGRLFIQELKNDFLKIAERSGEDPRAISDKFLKSVGEITVVDYRTLKKWLTEGNHVLTDGTYDKLVEVFKNVRTEKITQPLELSQFASDIGVDALDFEPKTGLEDSISDEKEILIGEIYEGIVSMHKDCKKYLNPRSTEFKGNFKDRLSASKKNQEESIRIIELCQKNNIWIYSALVPIWMQPTSEIFNEGEERTLRLRVYYISLIELDSEELIYPVNWNKNELI